MSVADQPFPELRVAILLVFHALMFQPWGQTIMNDHPGFREYLLDRSTEKNKEGKEGKYAIIQILADSPTVQDIFGDPYYVQLKTYCSEGPFYVRAQAQMAMEGGSHAWAKVFRIVREFRNLELTFCGKSVPKS